MRFAFADPVYLGCGRLYPEHPRSREWDDPETHRYFIHELIAQYPDGWLLCLSSVSLRTLLPMCPEDVRVAAWAKSFASFKPDVNPAYTWEPVIFRGGRRGDRNRPTVRDHLVEPITLRKGLTGAKPRRFCSWVLDLLGWEPGDVVDDLFPGTGVMGQVIAARSNRLPTTAGTLWEAV